MNFLEGFAQTRCNTSTEVFSEIKSLFSMFYRLYLFLALSCNICPLIIIGIVESCLLFNYSLLYFCIFHDFHRISNCLSLFPKIFSISSKQVLTRKLVFYTSVLSPSSGGIFSERILQAQSLSILSPRSLTKTLK